MAREVLSNGMTKLDFRTSLNDNFTELYTAFPGSGTALPATTGAIAVTMDSTIKTLTPTGNCTLNASGGIVGQICSFIVTTSGVTSYALTFGTNFKSAGVFNSGIVTAKTFGITFEYDGANWVEISRSTPIGVGTTLPGTSGTLAVTMDGLIKTLTPTNACTLNASIGLYIGQSCVFVITTSGTSSYVITFGTNFKSTGTLTTGTVSAKKFTVSFIWDGTNWCEDGRTTAM